VADREVDADAVAHDVPVGAPELEQLPPDALHVARRGEVGYRLLPVLERDRQLFDHLPRDCREGQQPVAGLGRDRSRVRPAEAGEHLVGTRR
jgi:hypothetical protein